MVASGSTPPAAGAGAPGRARIAVVGAGVAGLTAAWLLAPGHDVTLFERNDYAGGHTNTVTLPDGPDAGMPVDTGFIVMNHRNYPLFTRLLDRLGVALQDSDMSFSYTCEHTGFCWAGNGPNGLFAQRRNLLRPEFWEMLAAIARFHRRARRDLAAGAVGGRTLAAYARDLHVGADVLDRYLLPMGSAIWSAPLGAIASFPAELFLRFFDHHGLLSFGGQPTWRTVVGGSHAYVRRIVDALPHGVRLREPVRGLRRVADGVELRLADRTERFDHVVLAAHADESLALLDDPTPEERLLLGVWRYSRNRTVLHTDTAVLPPRRRAWSSWNYVREAGSDEGAPVTVTYHMNRLQRLRTAREYCVTLNRRRAFAPGTVIAEFDYTHPEYTFESLATQPRLGELSGRARTWYCGSYFGWGFHEDAVRSAAAVGRAFGAGL